MTVPLNPSGMCMCGCGRPAPVARRTTSKYGHVKGEHVQYIRGHHRRGIKHDAAARAKMSAAISEHIEEFGAPFQGRRHTEETKLKMRVVKLGPKHPAWRGDQKQSSAGYRMIYVGHEHPMAMSNGYALEHRLIAARTLGRMLEKHEDVHHRNGDKQDNRPENLIVLHHRKHSRWHRVRIEEAEIAAVRTLLAEGLTDGEIAAALTERRFDGEEAITE